MTAKVEFEREKCMKVTVNAVGESVGTNNVFSKTMSLIVIKVARN